MIFNSIAPLWLLIVLFAILGAALVFCIIKKDFRNKQSFRLIGILLLGVLMLARPQLPGGNVETRKTDIDIYFAVDATGSMVGKDMNGGKRRLEQAKEDIVYIAKQFPGARYTIFVQSAVSFQATPLISDISVVENASKAILYPTTSGSRGTNLSDLLEATTDKARSENEKNDHPKLFFFLSDGEETDNSRISTPDDLDELFVSGAVIGYGTESGTTIEQITYDYCYNKTEKCDYVKVDDSYNVTERKMDSNYGYERSVDHVSKLDIGNLESVADSAKVKYVTRNDISSLESITKDILNNREVKKSGSKEGYIDCYYFIAGLIIILLLWTLSDLIVKLLSERKVTND